MSLFEKGSVYEQPSVYNQGGGGGGGPIPTPDGYREVLYLRPDSENGPGGAITNLLKIRNDCKVIIPLIDFTDVQQWMIDNNANNVTMLSRLGNGESYFLLQQDSGGLKASLKIRGYSSGSYEHIGQSISNLIVDKSHAEIGAITLNHGPGSFVAGESSDFYVPMQGSETPPIKIGRIYVYDVDDTLIKEWRPVELIGGSDNRFGWLDVINNQFRRTIKNGRYFVPGPYVV